LVFKHMESVFMLKTIALRIPSQNQIVRKDFKTQMLKKKFNK